MRKRTTQTSNSEAKYDFTDLFNEILGTETSKKLFEDLASAFLMDPVKHATAAKHAERARERAQEKKAEPTPKAAEVKPVKAETLTDKNQQVLDLIRELTDTFKEYVKTTDERLQNVDYQLHAQELQLKHLTDIILVDKDEDSDKDFECDGDCEHCCINDDGNCDESDDIEDEDCNDCSAGAPEDEPMVRLGFKNGICVCIPARMLDTVFCPEVEGHSEIGVFKNGEEINTHDGAGAIMTSID